MAVTGRCTTAPTGRYRPVGAALGHQRRHQPGPCREALDPQLADRGVTRSASWHRGAFVTCGSNENTNGLLRQYFPKGTDLSRWSPDELQAVAHALNSRPRKTPGWKTPAEALNEHLHSAQKTGVATTG